MLEGIRKKIKLAIERNREKREFLNYVESEVKPIRRAAYLEEKKKQAIGEGQRLAQSQPNQQSQGNFNLPKIEEYDLFGKDKKINTKGGNN